MVDSVATAHPPAGTSRGMNITLWVLQGIMAIGFALDGLTKFSGSAQAVAIFEAMGTADWMPYAIGMLEIFGAIGLLIPWLSGTAALAFVTLMTGAVLSHLIWGGFPVPAVVLLILSAVIAYGRRSTVSDLRTAASRR